MNQILKQAWHQAKTNPVYTSLYVIGVTLTVMFIMIIGIVLYIRIAPVYPEANRENTMYITSHMLKNEGSAYMSNAGKGLFDELYSCLDNMKQAAYSQNRGILPVKASSGDNEFKANVMEVSEGFWKIYDFDLLAGNLLPKEVYETEKPGQVIITGNLAERMFGSPEEAIGKSVRIKDEELSVAGVVRSASYLTRQSYADIYCPMGIYIPGESSSFFGRVLGGGTVTLLTDGKEQSEALVKEVAEKIQRYNSSDKLKDGDGKWELNIYDQPISHWKFALISDPSEGQNISTLIWLFVIIILALLVVPAINLSGLIGGRMDTRLSELGIRKSYGATKWSLLRQVLFENFLLTSVGAILGIIGAWIMTVTCRRWIFSVFEGRPSPVPSWAEVTVNPDMLFAPTLFLILLVLCFLVNTLSAFVPAWLYMRKPIVSALYEKR